MFTKLFIFFLQFTFLALTNGLDTFRQWVYGSKICCTHLLPLQAIRPVPTPDPAGAAGPYGKPCFKRLAPNSEVYYAL